LWVYDRLTDRFRRDRPKNVGAITRNYALTLDDGRSDITLERVFALIEGRTVGTMRKCIRWLPISDAERDDFSVYMAVFVTRVPGFTRWLTEMKKIDNELVARPGRTTELWGSEPTPLEEVLRRDDRHAVEMFLKSCVEAEVPQNARLGAIVEAALQLARAFSEMNWLVVHPAFGPTFITTDNPFVFGTRAHTFPISSDCCITMAGATDNTLAFEHALVDSKFVHRTNVVNATLCDRFVLARNEKYLARVVEEADIRGRGPRPMLKPWKTQP